MEEIKLRKCPFCGGEPVFETRKVMVRYIPRYEDCEQYQVKCTICLSKTKLTRHKTAIIDLWNGVSLKKQE